jgi:diguanylate cyclase (GGDEF)-like protein
MSLDISTLVLLTIAIAYGLGALSILFTFFQGGTRGTRHWGSGMIGLGTGYGLMYLDPHLPGHALLYAGWVCILTSVLIMYRALLRICDTNESRGLFDFAVIGGAAAAWLFFGYIVPSALKQIDATSVGVSAITGRAAWDLWRYAKRTSFRAPPLAVAGWLLVVTATPLVEVLLREAGPGTLDARFLYGPPAVVFFRVLIITLLSISVLWLEISRLYEAIEVQATHDELTGVSNRRVIVAELQHELVRAQRGNSPCSIAIFDIDFFKRVNDTWGHPAGDQVLKQVTAAIEKNIRPYDTLGRYGGEEFLVVMPGAGPDAAASIADRARMAIQDQDCIVDGTRIRITISAGIATSARGVALDALLRSAEQAH